MADTSDDHRLVVSLEARIRNYEKAIERAQRETSRRMKGIEDALKGPRAEMGRFEKAGVKMASGFSRSVAKTSATLSSFATGIVAGGAFAAITSLTGALAKARQSLSDFEGIANAARTTGLRTDFFQAISFGALQADVSQEKLNAGLEIFAKNAGLAQQGTGALYSGLKNLNPELLKALLSTHDQNERLRLVADAMKQTTDATKQAALATTVFGKGGIELVRVLDGGAAALDKFKRRAAGLGLIIPDDLLQRAGELDDKLEILSKVIDVNLSQALVHLAPLLVSASEGAARFAQEFNALTNLVNNFTTNPTLDNFLKVINGGAPGGGLIDRAIEGAKNLASEFARSTADIEADIAKVKAILEDLKVQAEAGFEVGLETDRALDNLKGLQEELARTSAAGVSAANAIRAAFAQAFRASENASMAALGAMTGTEGGLPTVTRYGGTSEVAPSGGFTTQQDVNSSGVNVIKPVLDQTAGYTKDTADNVSELDRNTESYIRNLSSVTSSGFQTINTSFANYTDVVKSLLAQGYSLANIDTNMGSNIDTTHGSGQDHMFGDAINPETGGSYISSWGIRKIKKGTYSIGPQDYDKGPGKMGNITVGDINVNGVSDGAEAGRQAAYEFVRTVYGAMSGRV
ncbi:hypothetical protein LRP31_23675 [Mesorhizobium mediterraneum]|uniref:Bacteriophage tail tape measure N-terminal domain-containing protein n=1 Tax=Mesorhizobium mediterraneum TaxID=43617 RepID=A0AB36R035_9HYPH|nr:hypothetical protein [Mesorhizobium mediterraneum]PAP97815.1 hypothetical protein CIT25_35095 [Mesorhizobium mediterraneum]WIW52046.1 hypothetical protein LRP31_23675 [Mesorhizobium mediterraneum]